MFCILCFVFCVFYPGSGIYTFTDTDSERFRLTRSNDMVIIAHHPSPITARPHDLHSAGANTIVVIDERYRNALVNRFGGIRITLIRCRAYKVQVPGWKSSVNCPWFSTIHPLAQSCAIALAPGAECTRCILSKNHSRHLHSPPSNQANKPKTRQQTSRGSPTHNMLTKTRRVGMIA